MNIGYLYLELDKELIDAADKMKELINVSAKNKSISVIDQKRFSQNYGGYYFLFECFGLTLILAKNDDEDYEQYNYCLEVQSELKYSDEVFSGILVHLRLLMNNSNIKCEIEA